MSVWDDVKGALSDQGALGHAVRDVGHFLESQRVSPASKKNVGDVVHELSDQSLGVAGSSGGKGDPPPATPLSNIQNFLKSGISYGQEQNPNAQLLTQLTQLIGAMNPTDAAATLKELPAGSALATELTKTLSGQNPQSVLDAAQHPNPYGYDPLSIGNFAQTVIAPFLQQEQVTSSTGLNNLAKQTQDALSKASPLVQKDFGGASQTLNAALQTENAADANAAVTAPGLDSLISSLTNSVNAYKAAQAAAGAEPYWAATTGTGTVPSTGTTGTGANIAAQLAQQATNPAAIP